ncbi:biotin/lipoyl-binding protein [Leptolyngbya sp. 15MV]|nr:biotin/lipoyl-binding protein [Leptolyngbya sp. 15MV]
MRAKTVVAAIGIFGAIGLIAGGLAWWKYRSIRAAMSQPQFEPSEAVRTAEVRQFPFQRTASAVGTVSAIRHGTVAVEVAGKVSSVGFTSGETVEEGRVLLTLDASTEEADLRAAEANAALARVSLARLEQAMSGNAVSKQEIDRARARCMSRGRLAGAARPTAAAAPPASPGSAGHRGRRSCA